MTHKYLSRTKLFFSRIWYWLHYLTMTRGAWARRSEVGTRTLKFQNSEPKTNWTAKCIFVMHRYPLHFLSSGYGNFAMFSAVITIMVIITNNNSAIIAINNNNNFDSVISTFPSVRLSVRSLVCFLLLLDRSESNSKGWLHRFRRTISLVRSQITSFSPGFWTQSI